MSAPRIGKGKGRLQNEPWPWIPMGPKKGQKGPFEATHGKNGIDGLEATEICFVYPLEFSGLIHKRPGYDLSPSGLRQFSAVSQNAFRPGDPETGPNRIFTHETPQSYGKRVTWAWLARRSFWVYFKKCMLDFQPLGPEKQPKRPVSSHRREKLNQRLRPLLCDIFF